MRASEADLLFIPGLGGSSPDHWQTRWADKLSTGQTLDLPDPDRPLRDAWTAAILDAVAACRRPVILIAHSLGAIAAVQAARTLAERAGSPAAACPVRAAFLVAPPAAHALSAQGELDKAFADIPSAPLPFPSLLIASRNDPWASMSESEAMALDWGAQIVDAGESGHLNVESGHGPWPEGLMRLATFLARL